ncbi:LysR family transcriptional regulator [Aeromonas hydrophila]|uniref:LysR family transcriptional regulator n=1 Tax=Aeromonas hydrophila TaxID=644 RepID=UPI002B491377|nr:LysR family transcriptional regulator [Aeromonas hydrophila]
MNLRGVDLNLLVVLKALLEERNTTKAAERLAMSQPAVSRALARLRLLYDDPLLIRTPQGMEPTARAEALLLPLREILHDIEQTFSPPEQLDPAQFEGVLRIGAHTYVEYVMMPSLLARLQQQAPNLRIHMVPLNADYESQLDEGVISMVISKQDEVPGRFRRIPLFEDKLICTAHRSHPLQGQVLCIESFAQAQHLLVAPRGSEGGIVDDLLAAHGMTRHTPLIVQSFLAAPFILPCAPLLLTSPARVLRPLMPLLDLVEYETRFALPTFEVSLIRHRRDDNNAMLNWFESELHLWCRTQSER